MKKIIFLILMIQILGCKELPGPDILSGIKPHNFIITDPKMGTKFEAGDRILIQWNNQTPIFQYVRIALYLNNTEIQELAKSAPNTGVYEWTCLDESESNNYYFLLEPVDGVYRTRPFFSDKFWIAIPDEDSLAITIILFTQNTGRIFSVYPNDLSKESDYFAADSWTWNSIAGTVRSFMRFDFSLIPRGATIIDAKLYLYNYPLVEHSCLAFNKSNSAHLYRVISDWSLDSMCWNTQPGTTENNMVEIPAPIHGSQNYILDVTELVKDMLQSDNYGMMLRLDDETPYRRMYFASGHYAQPAIRPRLIINYK